MTQFPYSEILVSGNDAFDFLQGQLSNDLRRLEQEPRLLSAWCNPKGRVICLLRVTKTSAGYALALPSELAEEVVRRLTLFRFRAKVEFETSNADRESPALNIPAQLSLEAWQRQNLRDGIPEIYAPQSEKFTPHMLNLDRLDAISLNKGCYTGQEIVARTHYRGASKRRMLHFESQVPVAAGDAVNEGAKKVGEVINAIERELLALVPLDSADASLNCNGAMLSARPLPYHFT
tara:strand:+ start:2805 stop:3506 length:702 start_codon:yes stop_codon:yes gene_type:complete